MNELPPLPPAIKHDADSDRGFEQALQAYYGGDPATALAICRKLLTRFPEHPGANHLGGAITLEIGDAGQALSLLETANRLTTGNANLHQSLGDAHLKLQHWQEAASTYRQASNLGLEDAGLYNNLGLALKETGAVDDAILAYESALRLDGNNPLIYNNLGHALAGKSDYPGAIQAYRKAVELAPENADLWANLASAYEQSNRLEDAQLAIKQGLARDPRHETVILIAAKCARRIKQYAQAIALLKTRELQQLALPLQRAYQFEFGRIHDKLGDAHAAYEYFLNANRLATILWPGTEIYAVQGQEELATLRATFTPAWVQSWSPDVPADPHRTPAFIFGFPRSGTTLLDTILGSHPGITVLEEPLTTYKVIYKIRELTEGYPRALATLTADDIKRLRQIYWDTAAYQLQNDTGSTLVLDKNPLNTAHLGLIQRLFPNAKLIFTLRHPCDVCLSCFMQEFTPNPGTMNFLDLTDAARLYRQVMDLWMAYKRLLPLNVHIVRYEELVARTESTVRGLTDFLGIGWHEELQDHTRHAQQRGRINTASYHQVVQPIYKSSIDRWRGYRKYFGEALKILEPFVKTFGYRL